MRRNIQSYLYEFLNYKYLNTSEIHNFKQAFLDDIKEKKTKQEIKNTIKNYFSEENIVNFLNENWKNLFSFIQPEDYNQLLDLIEKFEEKAWIVFRYYQYLVIFYSFLVFNLLQNKEKQKKFLEEYKKYLENYSIRLETEIFDLKRLNYWMATWSWKTYLMYFMFELYINLFKNIKSVFLIVPAWLIYQHKQKIREIYWIDLQGETTNWTIKINWRKINLIVLSVNVLANRYKEKNFNPQMGDSIFIFDEWHKWALWNSKTEEFKKEILKWNNQFIFDWSATFQEIFKTELKIEKDKKEEDKLKINSLNKYFTSSIYNYNLTLFQADGFWKKIHYEFWDEAGTDETPTKKNLKKALNKFFEQVDDFENNNQEYKEGWINFYKPLFLAVSNEIWNNKREDEGQENNLIEVIRDFIELTQEDGFKERFYLDWTDWKVNLEFWKEEILMSLWEIKWLIYVWTNWINKINREFEKEKYKEILNISEDSLREEIFKKLDEKEDILFLFWSKKFIEWWDSKRPSTIFLLKWAKTSTVQAIQLLWRWLRLEWYNGDWFRHISYKKKSEVPLENLYLFWQDVNALKDFLEKSTDTTIKIVKIYWTKPIRELNKLKLPYLKRIEKEKNEITVIKLSKENIESDNTKNKIVININWKKIIINKFYKKIATIIEDWKKNKIDRNMNKFKIPYVVLKQGIKQIVNDLNYRNNWVFLIDESFWVELFDKLSFNENVWLTRQQQKDFILQIIKWILNKIYRSLNKEIRYKIDCIKEDDEDVKFEYEIIIKANKNNNEIFWLKLKNNKRFDNIIEIKDFNDLAEYFEIEDINKLEKEIEELDKEIERQTNKVFIDVPKKQKNDKQEKLNEQKENLLEKIFKEFEKKINNIPHLYHRIYHLYSRDNTWKEYNYSDLTVKVSWINSITEDNIEINPSSILKLNNLEAEVITKLVEKLKEEYKDIYVFRNPNTWNKCFEYEYEWVIHKFYPDFIFWLIDDKWNKTILYVEPKGGQDKAIEQKSEVFYQLNNINDEKERESIKKMLINILEGYNLTFDDNGYNKKIEWIELKEDFCKDNVENKERGRNNNDTADDKNQKMKIKGIYGVIVTK